MKKKWCNTVLVAYSALPKIIRQIDCGVKTRVNSGFGNAHLKNGLTTEQLYAEVARLNAEKHNIIALCEAVRQALRLMDGKYTSVLELRIKEKLSHAEIAKALGISDRTVFRRLEKAEEEFASVMRRMGCDENTLEKVFAGCEHLRMLKERMTDEKYLLAKNV